MGICSRYKFHHAWFHLYRWTCSLWEFEVFCKLFSWFLNILLLNSSKKNCLLLGVRIFVYFSMFELLDLLCWPVPSWDENAHMFPQHILGNNTFSFVFLWGALKLRSVCCVNLFCSSERFKLSRIMLGGCVPENSHVLWKLLALPCIYRSLLCKKISSWHHVMFCL